MSLKTPLSELEGRYVTTSDGVPIAAYETGNLEGPDLVLVHGFGFNHCAFQMQFNGQLARNYRLISYDMRGHGASGKPADLAAYSTTDAWAQDFEAVSKAFGISNPVVVAWSFGAMAFLDWVRHYGLGDVRGFVSVGSNAGLIKPDAEYQRIRANAVTSIEAKTPNFVAELREATQAVDRNAYQPIPANFRELAIAANMQVNLYARKLMVQLEHDHSNLIPDLTCPIRFILGEHDAANSEEGLGQLAKRLPNASVAMMQSVGHSPFVEDPSAFDANVAEFIAGLD